MSTPRDSFFKIFYSHTLRAGSNDRVRLVRKRLGMTQREMANRCEVSASLLSKIEEGARVLTPYMATKICVALPVNPEWLWLDTGEWESEQDYNRRDETKMHAGATVREKASCSYGTNPVWDRMPEGWEDRLCDRLRKRSDIVAAAVGTYHMRPIDAIIPIIEDWLDSEAEQQGTQEE